jgi:hypothetical protein
LRQVGQRRQHLARLVAVVVDGLLAQDHEAGLFLFDQRLEQLGHGQRLQFFIGLDQDAAVGADGHGSAQRFRHWATPQETAITSVTTPFSFRRTASSTAISSKGFMLILTLAMSTPLPSDFTHLDVVVHHAFYGYENFHERISY